MRKYLLKVLSLLCAAALLMTFSACSANESESASDNDIVYHTISFNTNGGTPVEDMSVRHGSHAHQPKNPVLENYIFCHWELPDGRTWFFDIKSVTEDITLEAVWIKAEKLFNLSPMPDSDGIMITEIRLQEELQELSIPSVINGKTVEGIGQNAFRAIHDGHAKKITFPDTITYIADGAFAFIEEVELVFNGEISYIGEEAFKSNSRITKISLGEGLEKIPFRAFGDCSQLKTLDIPEKLTVIEENAFENCQALLTIVLPSTLEVIESEAFYSCTKLKSVFFRGTTEEFDGIDIADGNQDLEDAKIYFYSEEKPAEDGMFWHYGSTGSPVIW